jgi:Tol biopolymer transport system component
MVGPDGQTRPLDAVTSGPENNPDWSPDGSRLTFVGQGSDLGSHPGLWVIGADGTGLRRLVACAGSCRFVDDPAWSPEGDQIAFERLAPGPKAGGTLEVVDVVSGRTRTLLTAKPGEGYAGVRYAPDGKAMVLEWVHATVADYDDAKGVTLIAVDLTTSPPRTRPLTDPALFAQTADWSPKGDLIVYAALPAAGARGTDLYLVRPDGTGRRRLTTLADRGGAAEHADFSNDAKSIVFVGADPQQGLDGLLQVDVATGAVSAFGQGTLTGHHPRSRPAS